MSDTPFKIGDLVISYFHNREVDLVRKVTDLHKTPMGWVVSTNDGGHCPHCMRPYGHRIQFAPAGEFKLTDGDPDNTALVKADACERYRLKIPFDSMGIEP